jgi:Flp pilus assembly protein TadG
MTPWNSRSTPRPKLARRLLKRLRREDGVAMVELAMVLPVLLTLVLGIFYFSEFLNFSTDETHLAAEAVRFAAVNNDPSSTQTIQQYVLSQAPSSLQNGTGDVTAAAHVYLYYPTGSTGAVGQSVRACVTATVKSISFLNLGTTAITQTATMRIEQARSAWTADTPPAACPLT